MHSQHLLALFLSLTVLTLVYGAGSSFLALHLGVQLICLGIFSLFLGSRSVRISYAVILSLLSFVAVLHADNFGTYGRIVRETVDAVLQTHGAEAVSYLSGYTSARFLPALISVLALVWVTTLRMQTSLGGGLSVAIITIGLSLSYLGREIPLVIAQTAADYSSRLQTFSESREALVSRPDLTTNFKGDVILILGESISRRHLNVYGYPRETTPFLSGIHEELTVYRDIISTHSHTNESLSRAFTFGDRTLAEPFGTTLDLITAAKSAGVHTVWLSNQNPFGIWDNAVNVIATQADRVRYHDTASGYLRERSVYDEVAVETLSDQLSEPSDSPRLFVVHLMAAHFPYCGMVPETYTPGSLRYDEPVMDQRFYGNMFTQLQTTGSDNVIKLFSSINCYDRAISYVDSLLEHVITQARRSTRPTAVVITADHGENPILDTGHDARKHSHSHVEVPFILWLNDHYSNALFLDDSRPGTLADLSHSLSHLLGLNVADTASRSLFSESYLTHTRTTLDGSLSYDEYDSRADNVVRTRGTLQRLSPQDRDRVWAHRTNTGGALMEAREVFQGVEMDMVFNGRQFRIYHPGESPDTGLTLSDQLKQDRGRLQYWLDWKNADESSVGSAVRALEFLHQRHDLKSRTLIEISASDGSARVLQEQGWTTSYYLPTNQLFNCATNCDEAERRSMVANLMNLIDRAGFTAVSFDARLIDFFEQYMLTQTQQRNLAVYSWAHTIDSSSESATTEIGRVISGRPWMKAILVAFPNYFYL